MKELERKIKCEKLMFIGVFHIAVANADIGSLKWPRVLNSTHKKGGDVTFFIMLLYIFNNIFKSAKDNTMILVSF